MDKMKVVKREFIPTRLPLSQTLISVLMMDYYNASGWVWGVVITLILLWWIFAVIRLAHEEDVNPFDHKITVNVEDVKKSFNDKINDKIKSL